MLIYRNFYLRPYGVSNFHLREHLFSPQLRWKFSCMNALNLNGTKRMQSQGETAQKDLRDTVISSRILEPMDNNMMVGEKMKNLYDSSAYGTAMEALSSLITRKKRGDKSTLGGKYTKLERMVMYIKILGLEENITKLKIIHVAGTKGKGSTCTFCEAILRECGFRTGLFTSPHLIDVRERFRLNGLDISQEKFLHYFWDCWNQLKKNVTEDLPMPAFFQFLTVLAFKIFTCEKVDVAIIEVGLGGTKDSTNVIKNPVVCGITPLGMDHMESLGNTLGQIASHKAGIFKPQVPAFTVPQLSEAMDVLQEKANELKVPLEVVAPLEHKKLNGIKLSLSGDHQYTNAGLAVALCQSWLQGTGNWEKLFQNVDLENNMPEAFLRGLTTARLSGRAQIVYDSFLRDFNTTSRVSENPQGNLTFYLDGAHSPESMEACARWFSSVVKEEPHQSSISKQILLFNCMDVRDPEILLSKLFHTCATSGTYFSKAIFVPSLSTYNKVTSASSAIPLDTPSKDLAWQFNLQTVWKKITNGKDVHGKNFDMEVSEGIPPQRFFHDDVSNCSTVVASLPLTIRWLQDYVEENPSFKIQVLVTGSLHFVGDVLKLLQQ